MATRVVVAEDEALIRLDLVETLGEEGYEVVGETGRGDEAVALVHTVAPDLVLLDIKMPGLDGLSAAAQIAETADCAVVILTAFGQRELIETARDAGVYAYLVKPFQPAELVASIELAVARHRERRALGSAVAALEEQLAVRKIVDRAKGLLMRAAGVTEPEAFKLLQKRAMDRRTTLKAVATAVVNELDAASRTGHTDGG